jgi:hypothetical protein
MNTTTAPEWTHHCYWLNVVQNCKYDTVHRDIMIFSLCAHLIPLLIGTHAFWLRCRHLWRGLYYLIRGRIVPSTVEYLLVTWTLESYARVVFLLVTLLDAWPNQIWKEVAFSVTLFPFMYGVILFLCGLVAAIPPSLIYTHHVNADGTDSFCWSFSHWSKTPQRLSGAGVYVPSIVTLQVFTTIMLLILPCTTIPFSIMNGFAWENGDWDRLLYWRRVEFLTWGIYVFIIFFITVYYSRGLSVIMRGSFQSSETNNQRNNFTSTDHSFEHGYTHVNHTLPHRHSYPLEESLVEPEDRSRGPLAFVQNRLNLRHSNNNHVAMSAAT